MEHKLDPNSSDCDPKHERKSDTSNSTQSDLRNATPIKQQPQINPIEAQKRKGTS